MELQKKSREIKFGVKLWSTNISILKTAVNLIEQEVFDYIELTTLPNTNIDSFAERKVPYIVHIPQEYQGVNIGDRRAKDTLKIINFSLDCADRLGADYIILHAGAGARRYAKATFSKLKDSRILLENMPMVGLKNETCLGYDTENIRYLNPRSNFGICLDFSHAVKASISLKKSCKGIISDFLKLIPKVFHVSDGDLINEKDEHLNIGEGKYDLTYFKECIDENPFKLVTLETPRQNADSLKEDLKNLNTLKSLWKMG